MLLSLWWPASTTVWYSVWLRLGRTGINRVNHWPLGIELTFWLGKKRGGTKMSMFYLLLCLCDDQLLRQSWGSSKSHLNSINSNIKMFLPYHPISREIQDVKGLYQMLEEIKYMGTRGKSWSWCPLDLYLEAELKVYDKLYFTLEYFVSIYVLNIFTNLWLTPLTECYSSLFLNDSMRILHYL